MINANRRRPTKKTKAGGWLLSMCARAPSFMILDLYDDHSLRIFKTTSNTQCLYYAQLSGNNNSKVCLNIHVTFRHSSLLPVIHSENAWALCIFKLLLLLHFLETRQNIMNKRSSSNKMYCCKWCALVLHINTCVYIINFMWWAAEKHRHENVICLLKVCSRR